MVSEDCHMSILPSAEKKDFINASVSVSPWVKSTRATEESQLAWNLLVSNVCFAVVSLKSIVKAHKITSRS